MRIYFRDKYVLTALFVILGSSFKRNGSPGGSTMSVKKIREIRDGIGKKGSEGVVISFDELSRIKN